jgi:hypothetical protein
MISRTIGKCLTASDLVRADEPVLRASLQAAQQATEVDHMATRSSEIKNHRTTVVGVFERRQDADRAVEELHRAGFRDDDIGFAVRGGESAEGTTDVTPSGAGEGATAGLLTGGVIGGLVGAAASGLIPGIGPVIAGGILASVLGGAAVGAAAGGILGALVGLGVPEEEARYYQGEFEAGRTIVTVKANGQYDKAYEILRSHGAYDVHGDSASERMKSSLSTPRTAEPVGAPRTAAQPGSQGVMSSHLSQMTTTNVPVQGDARRGATGSRVHSWDEVEATYRDAWQREFGASGRRWHDEEAGYRFGYEMSHDPRFHDREWNDAERDLRSEYSDWSRRNGYQSGTGDAWERAKDAARTTWESLRHPSRTP